MLKILAYPLTLLYASCFFLTLIVFHVIQWVCFNGFGYRAHKKSVDIMNLCLMRCLHILGTRVSFNNPYTIETDRPLIIVSNHQSMYDISPLSWFMRKFHPKYISKVELGKGIPSVSYNLKHGGSVLIDRKNPIQSINAIKTIAKYIETYNRSVVIFPEGSRSRDGNPNPFKTKGLLTLLEQCPNAIVIPITINNSWKLLSYGKFPMGLGSHIRFNVHEAIHVGDYSHEEILRLTEKRITEAINND